MKPRDDMDVMLHFDGEDRLEGEVNADKLAALAELREGVRTYLELETDALEPRLDRMWSKIERRIEANGHTARELDSAAVPEVREPEQAGMLARLKRWFGDNRGYVLTSAVTAAAVTLVMFAVRPTQSGETHIVKVPGPTKIVKVPVEKIVRVPDKSDRITTVGPADVDSLDVTEGTTGAVLRIPGEQGETATTVIWLSSEDDPI